MYLSWFHDHVHWSKLEKLQMSDEMKTGRVLLLYKARVTQGICIGVIISLSHFVLVLFLIADPFTLSFYAKEESYMDISLYSPLAYLAEQKAFN